MFDIQFLLLTLIPVLAAYPFKYHYNLLLWINCLIIIIIIKQILIGSQDDRIKVNWSIEELILYRKTTLRYIRVIVGVKILMAEGNFYNRKCVTKRLKI